MFTDIFPGRTEIPKTLIFAKSDDHAEDILRILREEWPLGQRGGREDHLQARAPRGRQARKSASHKPEELIQAFRNSYNPRVASPWT
jgi:type I restriction enzyme R subunit